MATRSETLSDKALLLLRKLTSSINAKNDDNDDDIDDDDGAVVAGGGNGACASAPSGTGAAHTQSAGASNDADGNDDALQSSASLLAASMLARFSLTAATAEGGFGGGRGGGGGSGGSGANDGTVLSVASNQPYEDSVTSGESKANNFEPFGRDLWTYFIETLQRRCVLARVPVNPASPHAAVGARLVLIDPPSATDEFVQHLSQFAYKEKAMLTDVVATTHARVGDVGSFARLSQSVAAATTAATTAVGRGGGAAARGGTSPGQRPFVWSLLRLHVPLCRSRAFLRRFAQFEGVEIVAYSAHVDTVADLFDIELQLFPSANGGYLCVYHCPSQSLYMNNVVQLVDATINGGDGGNGEKSATKRSAFLEGDLRLPRKVRAMLESCNDWSVIQACELSAAAILSWHPQRLILASSNGNTSKGASRSGKSVTSLRGRWFGGDGIQRALMNAFTPVVEARTALPSAAAAAAASATTTSTDDDSDAYASFPATSIVRKSSDICANQKASITADGSGGGTAVSTRSSFSLDNDVVLDGVSWTRISQRNESLNEANTNNSSTMQRNAFSKQESVARKSKIPSRRERQATFYSEASTMNVLQRPHTLRLKKMASRIRLERERERKETIYGPPPKK